MLLPLCTGGLATKATKSSNKGLLEPLTAPAAATPSASTEALRVMKPVAPAAFATPSSCSKTDSVCCKPRDSSKSATTLSLARPLFFSSAR